MMRVLLYHPIHGRNKLKLVDSVKGYICYQYEEPHQFLVNRRDTTTMPTDMLRKTLWKQLLGRMASKGLAVLNTPCRHRVQGMGEIRSWISYKQLTQGMALKQTEAS